MFYGMNDRSALFKLTFIFLFSFLSQNIAAGGMNDSGREYKSLLNEKYDWIVTEIAAGNMSADDGKVYLLELRKQFNLEYNDKAGMIDAFLDALEEDKITYSDAKLYFSLLQEGTLMEYRREKNKENQDSDQSGEETQQQQQGNNQEQQNKGDEKRSRNS